MKFKKTFQFRILFLLFIIGFSSLILVRTFEVSDYWWHVKSGLYILENQSIPFQDPFSWYGKEINLNWISHEWLGAVILALFHSVFGSQFGGYLFNIICLLSSFVLLFLFNEKSFFKNIRFTFIWTTLGLALASSSLNARPQLFSVLLLILTVGLLEKFKQNARSKSIWYLPIIAILWANLHGGSSNLVYIIPTLYLLAHLKAFNLKKWKGETLSKPQLKQLFFVTILSFSCLAINPHHTQIWVYPYENMADQFMMSIIQEWRSPDLKLITDWAFFIQFAIIGIIFIQTEKKIKCHHFLLIACFIALNLRSIRFGISLYVVATFFIFNYIPSIKNHKITQQYLYILAFAGVIFLTSSFFPTTFPQQLLQTIVPKEAIQLLQEIKPKRLYNEYDFGSELIYHNIPVFIDGRADLYAKHNLKDAISLTRGTENTANLLKHYNFDTFLVYKNTSLANYLSLHSDYELIQETETTLIFIKKNL